MAIKATVDSKSYSGIENIEVGGKTIELEETYTGTKTITANGNYDVSGYANAEVNVPTEGDSFTLQEKTVTENGEVTPDSGYDGLSKVTVNVPTSGGSGSSENSYEMGTFTIEEVTNNYTYQHSLGRIPKFAIVYPVSVEKDGSHTAYSISTQLMLNGLGQEDYGIANNDDVFPNTIFSSYNGVGYVDTVSSGSCPKDQGYPQLVEMTNEHVTVGRIIGGIANSGHLTVGTYGIIVG